MLTTTPVVTKVEMEAWAEAPAHLDMPAFVEMLRGLGHTILDTVGRRVKVAHVIDTVNDG